MKKLPALKISRIVFPALAIIACLAFPLAPRLFAQAAPAGATGSGSFGPVVTTASGLKYQDEVVGTGAAPQTGSPVEVKYTGKLSDGTVFDSTSMHPGEPTFSYVQGVTHLISGWTEGTSTMKQGGKRKLIIPPELGYGMDGIPNVIPPNATLIFEIELVKVSPASASH